MMGLHGVVAPIIKRLSMVNRGDLTRLIKSTYENTQSLGHKLDYLKNQGLRGMFFWDVSSDLNSNDPNSLINKAASELLDPLTSGGTSSLARKSSPVASLYTEDTVSANSLGMVDLNGLLANATIDNAFSTPLISASELAPHSLTQQDHVSLTYMGM